MDHNISAVELLVITIANCLVVTFFYMWWAGTSTPARFPWTDSLAALDPDGDLDGAHARRGCGGV